MTADWHEVFRNERKREYEHGERESCSMDFSFYGIQGERERRKKEKENRDAFQLNFFPIKDIEKRNGGSRKRRQQQVAAHWAREN